MNIDNKMNLLTPKKSQANEIDLLVSKNFKEKRLKLKITLRTISDATGVSMQQIAKYERGENRMSCGMLGVIAKTLETPVSYFFDTLTGKSFETK